MDSDEREIYQFLHSWGTVFVGAKEIARRATTKKRFYEDPNWAKLVLMRMQDRGVLESDIQGRYRIKPVSRKNRNKRWVAPDVDKILKECGVDVEESNVDVDTGGDNAPAEPHE
jgi:hypothetical protein